MSKRASKRKIIKWAVFPAWIVVLAAYVVSFFGTFQADGLSAIQFGLSNGSLVVVSYETVGASTTVEQKDGLEVVTTLQPIKLTLNNRPINWLPHYHPGSRYLSFLMLPMWIPTLVVGGLALWLWRRDRRPPAGHCRHCGYNLTGNVSGVCPECGTVAAGSIPLTP